LTRQEHRSIPCSVMRYISFLLLLFVLAGAGRAYSQQQRIEDPCPPISVTCPDTDTGSTLRFAANVGYSAKMTFNWTVSAGKIIDGQGTAAITVDTTGFGGQTFTATVEVEGLPKDCPNVASCSTPIVGRPPTARKFDQYGKETKAVVLTRPRGTSHRRTRRITNKGKAST